MQKLPMLNLLLIGGVFLSIVILSVVFISQLRNSNEKIDQLEASNTNLKNQKVAIVNELEDLKIRHEYELDILKSRTDVLDDAIDADKKQKPRINKIMAAINSTLPPNNSIEGCTRPTPGEILRIASAVVDMSDRYTVPAPLVLGVIRQESGFCNKAVSRAGAQGYMQLMPDTAAMVSLDIGAPLYTWKERDNIHLGTAYLSRMINEFKGDEELAIRAYNSGPHHVKKVINGEIETYYRETRDYLVKVTNYKETYARLGVQ